MEVCDNGHEEICFNSDGCPLCEAKDTITDLESEIEALESEIADRENNISDLYSRLREAQKPPE